MKKAGEFLKQIPDEAKKEQSWNNIMRRRIEWYENEYKRINDNRKISTKDKEIICKEILAIAQLEAQGGKCIRCGREWKKIEYDNIFGKGEYYEPACDCLIKCPDCKNQLYDYNVTTRLRMNGWLCPFCGFGLFVNNDPNMEKRYGKTFEVWYDSLKRKPPRIVLVEEKKK